VGDPLDLTEFSLTGKVAATVGVVFIRAAAFARDSRPVIRRSLVAADDREGAAVDR
jgi:hypothetical protein